MSITTKKESMNRRFLKTISFIGVVVILTLILVAVHELGHVRIFQTYGIEAEEIVILGYSKEKGFPMGWVRPVAEPMCYYLTPHDCWESIWALWRLNFTACKGTKLW